MFSSIRILLKSLTSLITTIYYILMETLEEIDEFTSFLMLQQNNSGIKKKINELILETWDENEGIKIIPMHICKFISRMRAKKDVMDYFYYILFTENIE